jgi:hypothetical protein
MVAQAYKYNYLGDRHLGDHSLRPVGQKLYETPFQPMAGWYCTCHPSYAGKHKQENLGLGLSVIK